MEIMQDLKLGDKAKVTNGARTLNGRVLTYNVKIKGHKLGDLYISGVTDEGRHALLPIKTAIEKGWKLCKI